MNVSENHNGRSYDAVPYKAEFIKRGLPTTFVEDLQAATAGFDEAIGRKILNKESRVASNANVQSLLRECVDIVRELDPIVRNLCAGDAAALAAWESASRVERASRHAKSNGSSKGQTPNGAGQTH